MPQPELSQPELSQPELSQPERNWAGNLTYRAERIHRPESVAELRELVMTRDRIRALGTRHSFSEVADSTDALVAFDRMPRSVEVDEATATATVTAGSRYAEVARRLDGAGFALPNLGSLPHISVVGACATGTHGSGVRNGALSTSVCRVELIGPDGELVTISRGDPDFDGMVVGLGALGVVTRMTLDLVPAFEMRQTVYEGLPLAAALAHLDELLSCAYSVCLFTDWRTADLTQVWIIERTDEPPARAPGAGWFTATPAPGPRHPVAALSAASCTRQQGVPGRWYERLPHFRPEAVPSSGDELQSEYLIPAADAAVALLALNGVRDRIAPALQICEVRSVAADRLWLSPSYGRDTVSVHFTWIADAAAVMPAIDLVEERLAPFRPRPHWAKIFRLSPEIVRAQYPRLTDFRALAHRRDPKAKFGNAFVTAFVGY